MKKIFYFIASAIVALGAVACQNEIDENITPGTQNEGISFTVSFDESTRIEGTVEGSTASFEFEGTETLYVGEAKLNNSEDAVNAFTADEENKAKLNALLGSKVTATVSEDNGLKFASVEFELAAENNITLSLACPALYFTVAADTEVVLTVNEVAKTYTAGNYFVGIDGTTAAISYTINSANGKSKTLTEMQNKVYNLGTLAAAVASVDGVNYTDIATALYAAASTGKELVLASDLVLTEDLGMATFADVTIDLNGKTISTTATETTKDSFLRASSYDGNAHTVTIKNGTIALNDSYKFALTVSTAITLNLESVTINNARTDNLGSGLIVATGSTVNLDENCVINAKGTYTAVEVAGGTLNVNGATISAEGGEGIALSVSYEGTAKVASGTTITGSEAALYVFPTEGTINVTGGTFSTDPSEFVADGYLALKNYKTENYYDVVAVTKSTWHVVGNHTDPSWAPSTNNTPMYQINGTDLVVAKEVSLAKNEIKFIDGANWDTAAGSPQDDAITLSTWFHAGTTNITINTEGKYNLYYDTNNQVANIASIDTMLPELTFKTYYLNTGGASLWNKDNAWFGGHFWTGSAARDYKMTLDGDMASIKVPIGFSNVIFLRMGSKATDFSNMWTQGDNGYWNKTSDLTITDTNNCYTITSWSSGKWSTK